MTDCPECKRPTSGRLDQCCYQAGSIGCLRHQAARERAGNEQTALLLDLERTYTSNLKSQLAAALARADLYKQGYEARGKILAAYRTGGRPSEKALDAAADVATRLALLNPESGAKGEGGGEG